jgi:hypothetical protein
MLNGAPSALDKYMLKKKIKDKSNSDKIFLPFQNMSKSWSTKVNVFGPNL